MIELDRRASERAPHRADAQDGRERAARAQLRAQIGDLERRLAQTTIGAPDAGGLAALGSPAPGAPRVLSLGELEQVRDALADGLRAAHAALARRGAAQERHRSRLEAMLLEPGRHRFERVARRDLGEDGCGVWQVRPRLGLIGMLMGWWQVKLSSGCPLAA